MIMGDETVAQIGSASLNTLMPLTPMMSAFGRIAGIKACLLYPQKRTLVERVAMFA